MQRLVRSCRSSSSRGNGWSRARARCGGGTASWRRQTRRPRRPSGWRSAIAWQSSMARLQRCGPSRDSKRAEVGGLTQSLEQARTQERATRDAWRTAQRDIGIAQLSLDKAQRAVGELATRQSALEEARVRLQSSLSEAEGIAADATAALAEAGDETEASAVSAAQVELTRLRQALDQARSALSGMEATARVRDQRIVQLGNDMASWQRRRDGAAAQLQTLEARAAETQDQLEAMAATPNSFEARRDAIDEQIGEARSPARPRRRRTERSRRPAIARPTRRCGSRSKACPACASRWAESTSASRALSPSASRSSGRLSRHSASCAEQTAAAAGIRPRGRAAGGGTDRAQGRAAQGRARAAGRRQSRRRARRASRSRKSSTS